MTKINGIDAEHWSYIHAKPIDYDKQHKADKDHCQYCSCELKSVRTKRRGVCWKCWGATPEGRKNNAERQAKHRADKLNKLNKTS